MVEIRGVQIANSPAEMTVGQFEKLTELVEGKVFNPSAENEPYKYDSEVQKWSEILVFMGLPSEELEDMELSEFKAHVKAFNQKESAPFEVVGEITIKGKTYKAFDKEEDFTISVTKWARIQKLITGNRKKSISLIMAVIFEDVALSKKEHVVESHINLKASIFRKEMNAGVAIPYLVFITKKAIENLKDDVLSVKSEEL